MIMHASLGKRVPRRLTLPECKTVLRLAGESYSSHGISKCAVVHPHRTGHGWLHWCTLLELRLTTWQWTRTVQLVDCIAKQCGGVDKVDDPFTDVYLSLEEVSRRSWCWSWRYQFTRPRPRPEEKNCRETASKQDCVSRLNITAFNTLQVLTVYR